MMAVDENDIAVISNPLQALGLFEWCRHPISGGRRPVIVLPWQANMESRDAIIRTLDVVGFAPDFDCGGVLPTRLRRFGFERSVRWGFLLSLVPALQRSRRLIIGNYFNRDGRFLAAQSHGDIVLLDDGTATEQAAELRMNPPPPIEGSFAARTRMKLSSPPARAFPSPSTMTFFTFFADLKLPAHDALIVHAFDALRERVGAAEPLDETWFVGTPFVESLHYPISMYLEFLDSLANRFGRIVYIPHRHESPTNLAIYREKAALDVRPFGMSLEAHLLLDKNRPRRIVSTASSVLETLPRIFGRSLELFSVRLPLHGLPGQVRTEIEECYRVLGCVRNGLVAVAELSERQSSASSPH